MNAIKLLCCALLLTGLACKHPTASSVQTKEFECNKLVDEIFVAYTAFVTALTSVRDLETANEATVRIREIAGRFDRISEKFAQLGPLSQELKLRLLKKLELGEAHLQSTISLESVRVLTSEEDKIITPACELYFGKNAAMWEKSGLYYTASEYHNATDPH